MSNDMNTGAGAAGGTSVATADSDETTMISVDSLGKIHVSDRRTAEVLSDVEFAVEDGELVCIIGPPGYDKTTLFHTIADLENTTSGAVTLGGSPVTDPGTDRGMVFQEYGLFPWRIVSKNVTFGLEEQGVEELARPERVTEILGLIGLDSFADAYPKELSDEMRQHVGVAQALAADPELFLMDEPSGAVDAQTRDILHGELLDIQAGTDKTVLFVTHDVEETVMLADRVVVMAANLGRVREIVPVDIDRPRERTENEFTTYIGRVREFVGR